MTRCFVPTCRCRTKRDWLWWLCRRHWGAVPLPVKRERRVAQAEYRKMHRRLRRCAIVSLADRRRYNAVRCRVVCAWLACIREARIAAAMGAV